MIGPEVSVHLEPWRAVYVEIPKVCCTSFKYTFAGLLGIELPPDDDPHRLDFPALPFTRAGKLYPGMFSFVFVRNPWDRLVSAWRDKIRLDAHGYSYATERPGLADCFARFDVFEANMPFPAFVDAVASIADDEADAHFRSQYTFVTNEADEIGVDFVGRYESLEADLARVQALAGLPRFELPRMQVSKGRERYTVYYDDRTREQVAHRYATDIDVFGYRFGA